MLLSFDSKISLNLNKHCSVHLFIIFVKENKLEKGRKSRSSDPCCDNDACSFPGLSGLHLMNITGTKFFKHVKAIKIIWTGVHCMFVAQMTIYTDLFFEIGIEE